MLVGGGRVSAGAAMVYKYTSLSYMPPLLALASAGVQGSYSELIVLQVSRLGYLDSVPLNIGIPYYGVWKLDPSAKTMSSLQVGSPSMLRGIFGSLVALHMRLIYVK